MWMGLVAVPSAMILPVEKIVTELPPARSTSAQGSIVTMPLIDVSEDRMCGLLSAVHVSVFTELACDVGPAVGLGQSIATPLATSARIAPAPPNNSIP